ncbi:MAG: hypothetical protein MSH27_09295 [Desulfovibrio piger]|nr:hypothetical protein [Desulfovibrio piger]
MGERLLRPAKVMIKQG